MRYITASCSKYVALQITKSSVLYTLLIELILTICINIARTGPYSCESIVGYIKILFAASLKPSFFNLIDEITEANMDWRGGHQFLDNKLYLHLIYRLH